MLRVSSKASGWQRPWGASLALACLAVPNAVPAQAKKKAAAAAMAALPRKL